MNPCMKCKLLSVALRKLKYITFVQAFHDRLSVLKRNKESTDVIELGSKILDPQSSWWPTSSVPMILNFRIAAKQIRLFFYGYYRFPNTRKTSCGISAN